MQLGESCLDGVSMRVDEVAESGRRFEAALYRDTMLRGISAGLGIGEQPTLSLFDAALKELLTLD
jgi:hypothetical protein